MGNLMMLRFRPPGKPRGIARVQPKTEEKECRFIWWPTDTAVDRQRIEIGVPFIDKFGEKIVVERNPKTGALKSRCLRKAENQK